MEEKDPVKRLSYFSVRIQFKQRIHVLKSLMFASSLIYSENEKQGRKAIADSFEGFDEVMHTSIKKRLHHHLCPKKADGLERKLTFSTAVETVSPETISPHGTERSEII